MLIKDLLFPKACLGCGFLGIYLCPDCIAKLSYIEKDVCFYCKKTCPHGLTHSKCLNKFNIDGVTTIFHYNWLLKRIVKNIKYQLATEIWRDLEKIILPLAIKKMSFYSKLSPPIYLQPIPLSAERMRKRGFNQAFLISLFFSRLLGFPIIDSLLRVKETRSQAELKNIKDRQSNLRNAFRLKDNNITGLKKAKIILVDDIITSGFTIKEAAKPFKKKGIDKIYAMALGRG